MLPTEITWVICQDAQMTATELKAELGTDRYAELHDGL